MANYILKRILLFIPTLVIISIVAFLLSTATPGDKALALIQNDLDQEISVDISDQALRYQKVAEKLDLNKPTFYFSILPISFPDTIHKILPLEKRSIQKAWLRQSGNWLSVEQFQECLNQLLLKYKGQKEIENLITKLNYSANFESIESILEQIKSSDLKVQDIDILYKAFTKFKKEKSTWKNWIPGLQWHGFKNRYHAWISKLVKGDFGISVVDGRSSKKKIMEALKWTLSITLIAIFLVYLIGIPLGFFQALQKGKLFDALTSNLFNFIYAIPVFWLATLLIVFFTNDHYSKWMNIFPSVGVYIPNPTDGFWEKWWNFSSKLILPIFCIVLNSMAFLSKQMRNSLIDESKNKYFQTALAKGLSKFESNRKHTLINSLFPMISILASAFPSAIAGSVVIEVIFNIPGVGRMMFESILAKDWSVVFAILMLIAFVTVISYLIVDVLYALVNPKVKYNKHD